MRLKLALWAVIALLAAFWRWHTAPEPPTPTPAAKSSLPAAAAIGPGVAIAASYADGSGGMRCTAGFLVRSSTGHPGLLSAGHCNRPGGPGTAAITYAKTDTYEMVGTFATTVFDGDGWGHHDIAVIALDRPGAIPLTSHIADRIAVTDVNDHVAEGEQLCHLGIRTGMQVCGPVVKNSGGKVAFAAPTGCGDSGGPVYTVRPDGTAAAVGVLVAGSNADDFKPGCERPARFSVAELIKPWLDEWELTVVTTPAPAAQR